MPDYFESGAFNRRGAWHGNGNVWQPEFEGDFFDWLTALTLSGLDWNVVKEPIFRKGEPTGKFWTIRESDDAILGHSVGDSYKVIQNVEGFRYLDKLVDDGDLEIETAISIYGGKVVTILARKPDQIQIAKDATELFDTFIGFTNRHDGMGACKVFTCRERVVCANTQAVAEGEYKKSGRHWSIRHQGNTELKLSEARSALELSFEEDVKFEAAMTELLNQPLAKEQYASDMREVMGLRSIDRVKHPRQYRNAKATAFSIDNIRRETPNLQNVKNTNYGFFQAVTQYETHVKKYRNEGTKFQSLAVEGGDLTNRAFAVLTQ